MKRELDNKLTESFPLLYRDRMGDPRNTAMCFGFPNSGWFDLIYELSGKLETLIKEVVEKDTVKSCTCGCPKSCHELGNGKCFNQFHGPHFVGTRVWRVYH